MTKTLKIYHDVMTIHEKYLLLVFQELSRKVRPFSTKKVIHLRKPISAEEGLAITYVTLQYMNQRKATYFNSEPTRVLHHSL